MNVQEWLGKDNQLGVDTWITKYQLHRSSLPIWIEKKIKQDKDPIFISTYNEMIKEKCDFSKDQHWKILISRIPNGIFKYSEEDGLEDFDSWLDRVSGSDKELKEAIKFKQFLLGGRTLSNRGTGRKASYNNCYSRGFIEDNINDIMQANTDLALTYKAQGGQGLSLSKIRPKGTGVGNSYTSDGIIPFMEMYDITTASISQGGSRKGALMISLDIRHKQAEDFITIKSNSDKITKANLSLEIDDEFMEAVNEYYKSGKEIVLHESRDYNGHLVEYDIVPIKLYKLMIDTAYDWGEPGCLFTNRLRNYNLMEFDDEFQIETTNPCGNWFAPCKSLRKIGEA